MDPAPDFESCLRRLLTGLADQAIQSGQRFSYDGGELYADEVAEIALPSVLCIAQALAEQLGVGGFGYRFGFGAANPVFPLHAVREQSSARFFQIAPFVTEVFDNELMSCRGDLARLFEMAARLVRPGFTLEANARGRAAAAVGAVSPVASRR